MNSRDRLLAALKGEAVDRVPIWLLFPYHRIGCYVDVRTNPCYGEIFEQSRLRAAMLDRRHLAVPIFAPDVTVRSETVEEDGWDVRREVVEWRDVRLTAETRRRGDEVRVLKPIRNEDDLRAFCRLPVETDRDRLHAALDRHLEAHRRERAELPADCAATMLDLGEPIGVLYSRSELTEYPIWSLTCDELVRDLLDRLMERLRIVYSFCLERDLAEVYFLVGSELASPPMVSRDTFRRWIVPYARELIAMIHERGRLAIQHYHGQIREVLGDFLEMAPDGLHTIEAPPNGNCTMTQAYDAVGDRITLIGNVQYDCFRSCRPGEMREAVRALLEECRGRRLILSPSAGPYEEVIGERMQQNYLEFMEAGWEFGRPWN